MSNRVYKSLSEKYMQAMEKVGMSAPPESAENFNRGLISMLNSLGKAKTNLTISKEDIAQIERQYGSSGWISEVHALNSKYAVLYHNYQKLTDAEKSINRIEGKAHRRALFYRILTTLGIGFSVMLVYYVAQCLNISMPLKVSA